MKDGRRDRGPNVPSGIKLRDNEWDEKTQGATVSLTDE